MLTSSERSLRARLAAHSKHAKYDGYEATRAARDAFLASFEKAVDPDGSLAPEERLRRADQLRKAHFTRLALRSAVSRRRRREADSASRTADG